MESLIAQMDLMNSDFDFYWSCTTDACTPLFIWWGASKMLDFREIYLKHQFIKRQYIACIDTPYDRHFHKSCPTLK